MPTPEKQQIEIEIAVRDMITGGLKEIARELQAVNKQAMETGAAGSDSLEKFRRRAEDVGESIRRSTGHLQSMSGVINEITKRVAGPVGLVAAIVAVGKSLDTFAVSQLQLKSFATDTGFAQSEILKLRMAIMQTGQTSDQANAIIARMGGLLTNAATYKTGSELFKSLSSSIGGTELFWQIERMAEAGDKLGAVNLLIKRFNELSPASQQFLSDTLGIQKSVLENLNKETLESVKPHVFTPEEQARQKRFNDEWLQIKRDFIDNYESLEDKGIKVAIKTEDYLRGLFGVGPAEGATDEEKQRTSRAAAFGNWLRSLVPGLATGGAATYGQQQSTNVEDQQRVDIAKDSTKKLGNISDSLHRIEDPSYGGGTDTSASAPTSSASTSGPASGPPGPLPAAPAPAPEAAPAAPAAPTTAAPSPVRRAWDAIRSGARSITGGLVGRAEGGPVEAGQSYLVGEHGPEVFVPKQSGDIEGDTTFKKSLRASIDAYDTFVKFMNATPLAAGQQPTTLSRIRSALHPEFETVIDQMLSWGFPRSGVGNILRGFNMARVAGGEIVPLADPIHLLKSQLRYIGGESTPEEQAYWANTRMARMARGEAHGDPSALVNAIAAERELIANSMEAKNVAASLKASIDFSKSPSQFAQREVFIPLSLSRAPRAPKTNSVTVQNYRKWVYE